MADRRWALVMRTVDRAPRKNYVGETLANLERAGLFRSEIPWTLAVVDSGSPDGFFDTEGLCRLHAREAGRVVLDRPMAKRTPNLNAARALELGAATRADWVLFLEDDVDFCANFLESVDAWIGRHKRADRRVYTFCAAYEGVRTAQRERRESWDYPIGKFYGTQAYALWKDDARACADWMRAHPTYHGANKSHDLLLKQWSREAYPKVDHFLASAPSFVQHIGRESSLHFGRFHDYASFPGRQWGYA